MTAYGRPGRYPSERNKTRTTTVTYVDLESDDTHTRPGDTLVLAGAHGDDGRTGIDHPHDAESVVDAGGYPADQAEAGEEIYVYDAVTETWWRSRVVSVA